MPSVAISTHEEDAIAFDALGDVDCEFQAVRAKCASCLSSVDGSSTVVAEDGRGCEWTLCRVRQWNAWIYVHRHGEGL